jgi:hypothetical protein
MMKKIILLSAMVLSLNAVGQKFTDSSMVGVWRSERILKKPANPIYRSICDSFENATFKLNADHTFEISTDMNSQDFADLRKMTKGKKWKFDPVTNFIRIGDEKDSYSTMKIKVKGIDGKTVFGLEETYHTIQLQVEKYEPKK